MRNAVTHLLFIPNNILFFFSNNSINKIPLNIHNSSRVNLHFLRNVFFSSKQWNLILWNCKGIKSHYSLLHRRHPKPRKEPERVLPPELARLEYLNLVFRKAPNGKHTRVYIREPKVRQS